MLFTPDRYGVSPFDEFLTLETPALTFLPHEMDISEVRWILSYAGKLPMELVLDIMEFAGYRPRRSLEVLLDPLHPTNRGALVKYLDQC